MSRNACIGAIIIMFFLVIAAIPVLNAGDKLTKTVALKTVLEVEPYADLISWNGKTLVIEIFAPLTSGSDGSCQYFAELIKVLFAIEKNMQILVKGEWIPSEENPISYAGSQKLLDS